MRNKIPLPKALCLLLLITTAISGGGYMALQALRRKAPSENHITKIVQTGPEREALKTIYLAEVLGLSQDRPSFSAQFDLQKAREKLLRSPVIKQAELKLLNPSTLYIAYAIRQPLARSGDVENGAIDEAGYLFPLTPFYAPKLLPEIYLGLKGQLAWNQQINHPKLPLALDVLRLLSVAPYNTLFHVQRIDVSRASQESLAAREIVLLLTEKQKTVYLRLTTKNYAQELGNYLQLRTELAKNKNPSAVVDLRIPQLAFIEEKK